MKEKKKLKKIKKHLNRVYELLEVPKDERIYTLSLSTKYGCGSNVIRTIQISSEMEFEPYGKLVNGAVFLGVSK